MFGNPKKLSPHFDTEIVNTRLQMLFIVIQNSLQRTIYTTSIKQKREEDGNVSEYNKHLIDISDTEQTLVSV